MAQLEKHQYWFWFLLLAVAWVMALLSFEQIILSMPLRVLGTTVFFVLFFLSPLLIGQPRKHTLLFLLLIALTTLSLWPESNSDPSLFSLLIYTIISGKGAFRLKSLQTSVVGGFAFINLLLFFSSTDFRNYLFLILYALIVGVALAMYKWKEDKTIDAISRNEALFSEYRKMKRQLISGEKAVREEERTHIAREIHDSVGHKLTALLMHIEVLRLKETSEGKEGIQELKELAKDSLAETRKAVKTLKDDGKGGLPAILQLIRKLEAENLIQIQFTMRPGALTAPLRSDQTSAVYRAVQEALTNVMKHGHSREVQIMFEAPAGVIFRFEVSNKTEIDFTYREGFGLKSMKERIESTGGTLETKAYSRMFLVRGTLPISEMEEITT